MEREQKAGDRDRALNNQNKRQITDLIAYKRGLQEEQQCGAEIQQVALLTQASLPACKRFFSAASMRVALERYRPSR